MISSNMTYFYETYCRKKFIQTMIKNPSPSHDPPWPPNYQQIVSNSRRALDTSQHDWFYETWKLKLKGAYKKWLRKTERARGWGWGIYLRSKKDSLFPICLNFFSCDKCLVFNSHPFPYFMSPFIWNMTSFFLWNLTTKWVSPTFQLTTPPPPPQCEKCHNFLSFLQGGL